MSAEAQRRYRERHPDRIIAYRRSHPGPGKASGERNGAWRGDGVGYTALHQWIYKQVGRAVEHLCAECLGPANDWANVSGEYRRDTEDFIPLCRSCHIIFDQGVIT